MDTRSYKYRFPYPFCFKNYPQLFLCNTRESETRRESTPRLFDYRFIGRGELLVPQNASTGLNETPKFSLYTDYRFGVVGQTIPIRVCEDRTFRQNFPDQFPHIEPEGPKLRAVFECHAKNMPIIIPARGKRHPLRHPRRAPAAAPRRLARHRSGPQRYELTLGLRR